MTFTHPVTGNHQSRWLRDVLRGEIFHSAHPAGTALPSEITIMGREYQSRATVRGALRLLRDEGVIERIPGTGTLAVSERFSMRMTELHGAESLSAYGFSNRVLERRTIPMPRLVARKLRQPAGSPCLLLEYIGYHQGSPTGVYTNYIRYPQAAAVCETEFRADWWTLLADAGLSVSATDLHIESLPADEELAAALDTTPGQPILGVEQLIFDDDENPFNYALLRNRGDRIALYSVARRAEHPSAKR